MSNINTLQRLPRFSSFIAMADWCWVIRKANQTYCPFCDSNARYEKSLYYSGHLVVECPVAMDMPADKLRLFVQYILKRQVGPANHVLLVAAYCHVQNKYMLYTNDIRAPPLLLSREQLPECTPAVVKALTRLYKKSYPLEEMCRSAPEQNYQLHARIHGKPSDTCFLSKQKPAPAANCTLGMSSLPLPRLMVPPALLLISQCRRFQRHLILFL